jgi:hypothetical protein
MQGTAHFSVSPPGIVKLTRQMYWYEGKQLEAAEMLWCFDGIRSIQVKAILNGDATIDENCQYQCVEDSDFKNEIAKHLKWVDSQLFIEIAGWKVPRKLLEEYGIHVVKRLRSFTRSVSRATVNTMSTDYLLDIMRLEEKRRELHEAILDSIDLTKDDSGYLDFQYGLTEWLERVAGKVLPTEYKESK